MEDYYNEDYGGEDEYYGEDDEERAIKESKKEARKVKKQAKSKLNDLSANFVFFLNCRGEGSARVRHRRVGASLPW